MGEESRRNPRLYCHLPAIVLFKGAEEETRTDVIVRNLSDGGMRLERGDSLSKTLLNSASGFRIEVKLSKNKKLLRGGAKVVWKHLDSSIGLFSYGITFIEDGKEGPTLLEEVEKEVFENPDIFFPKLIDNFSFPEEKGGRQLEIPYPKPHRAIKDKSDIHDRFLIEQYKSSRYGYPLCVGFLRINSKFVHVYDTHMDSFKDSLFKSIRICDEVFYVPEPRGFFILIPHTNIEGTQILLDRILSQFEDFKKEHEILGDFLFFQTFLLDPGCYVSIDEVLDQVMID